MYCAGVSRWDTCAAQAIIEAKGGVLAKMTDFVKDGSLNSYTYLKSSVNLDFEPGTAALTAYNTVDKSLIKAGEINMATELNSVKVTVSLFSQVFPPLAIKISRPIPISVGLSRCPRKTRQALTKFERLW